MVVGSGIATRFEVKVPAPPIEGELPVLLTPKSKGVDS